MLFRKKHYLKPLIKHSGICDPKFKIELIKIADKYDTIATHIWGRGGIKEEYIPEIPLDGPIPGQMFDMMANTPSPGNEKKILWEKGQLEKALQAFKYHLYEYMNSPEFCDEFSNLLQVNIFQYENEKIDDFKP